MRFNRYRHRARAHHGLHLRTPPTPRLRRGDDDSPRTRDSRPGGTTTTTGRRGGYPRRPHPILLLPRRVRGRLRIPPRFVGFPDIFPRGGWSIQAGNRIGGGGGWYGDPSPHTFGGGGGGVGPGAAALPRRGLTELGVAGSALASGRSLLPPALSGYASVGGGVGPGSGPGSALAPGSFVPPGGAGAGADPSARSAIASIGYDGEMPAASSSYPTSSSGAAAPATSYAAEASAHRLLARSGGGFDSARLGRDARDLELHAHADAGGGGSRSMPRTPFGVRSGLMGGGGGGGGEEEGEGEIPPSDGRGGEGRRRRPTTPAAVQRAPSPSSAPPLRRRPGLRGRNITGASPASTTSSLTTPNLQCRGSWTSDGTAPRLSPKRPYPGG